jgi:hypothetical protein
MRPSREINYEITPLRLPRLKIRPYVETGDSCHGTVEHRSPFLLFGPAKRLKALPLRIPLKTQLI